MLSGLTNTIAQELPVKALDLAYRFKGTDRQTATRSALQAWAAKDARAALAAVAEREIPMSAWLERTLVAQFARQDPARAFEWVIAQPASSRRSHLLRSAVVEMAKTRPRDALDRALGLRGREREQSLHAAIAEWARREERAAAGWVAGNDALSTAERLAALRPVLHVWGDRDAPAALAWLLAQPPQWHPAAVSIISAAAAGAPEHAARLVERLSDRSVRRQARGALARAWAVKEPRAAVRWVADVTDAAERRDLYSRVFSTWAHEDREAAADAIRLLRSAKDRDAMRRQLIQVTTYEDVEFAEGLYLRINDADELRQAAALLYHYWQSRDSKRADRYLRAAGFDDRAG